MLAFDTATPAVTVALHDGVDALAERTTVDARRQGELLATSIEAVLSEAGASRADLDVVVAGVGPGPYTGLRAGLVTAQVLGSALGVPVHGVCTLDVIARDAVGGAGGREFLVATDARRREVYWARYSAAGERVAGPDVDSPAALPGGLPVAGEGPLIHPDLLGEPIEPAYPAAATLAAMAAEALAAGALAAGTSSAGGSSAAGLAGAGWSAVGRSAVGRSAARAGAAGGRAGALLLPPQPMYLRRPDARVPGPPKRVTPAPPPAGAQRREVRP